MAFLAHADTHFSNHRSIFARIGDFFIAYAESRSRYDQIEALNELSDEELAERGMTRDTILRHVFADTFYL